MEEGGSQRCSEEEGVQRVGDSGGEWRMEAVGRAMGPFSAVDFAERFNSTEQRGVSVCRGETMVEIWGIIQPKVRLFDVRLFASDDERGKNGGMDPSE